MQVSSVKFVTQVEEHFEGQCSTITGRHGTFRFRLAKQSRAPSKPSESAWSFTGLEVNMEDPTHNFGESLPYKGRPESAFNFQNDDSRLLFGTGFPRHDSSCGSLDHETGPSSLNELH